MWYLKSGKSKRWGLEIDLDKKPKHRVKTGKDKRFYQGRILILFLIKKIIQKIQPSTINVLCDIDWNLAFKMWDRYTNTNFSKTRLKNTLESIYQAFLKAIGR